MKNIKKAFALLACVLSVLLLGTACGGKGNTTVTTALTPPPREATGIRLLGVPDTGYLERQSGKQPDYSSLQISVQYNDGTSEEVKCKSSYVTQFDPTLEAPQTVTVSYAGFTASLEIRVTLRQDLIDSFTEIYRSLSLDTLAKTDRAQAVALRDAYRLLNGSEILALPVEVREGYQALQDASDRLQYASYLTDAAPSFHERFDFVSDRNNWSDAYISNVAAWTVQDGYLLADQISYKNATATSYLYHPGHTFTDIRGVTCDIRVTGEKQYAGFIAAVREDAFYYPRLVWSGTTLTVELYQYKNGALEKMGSNTFPAGKYEQDDWHRVALFFQNGTLIVYVDDTLSIRATAGVSDYNEGMLGMRIIGGNANFDNITVWGTAVPRTDVPLDAVPTQFTDDFTDTPVGGDPAYWVEKAGQDNWKVFSVDGTPAYGTDLTTATESWLHGFSRNPTFSARVYWEQLGSAGISVRMNVETAYLRAGYHQGSGRWYITATQGTDFEVQTFWADAPAPVAGRWYSLRLEAEGNSARFYVDDVLILSVEDRIHHDCMGRASLWSNGAAVRFTDITYEMPEGGRVTAGVIEQTLLPTEYHNYGEIEATPDGNFLLVAGSSYALSTDGGVTFSTVGAGEYAEAAQGTGLCAALLRKHDGSYLRFDGTTTVWFSDDLKTWTQGPQMVPDNIRKQGNTTLAIFHTNNATEILLPDGTYRIFFPMAFRRLDSKGNVAGHDTYVYYSDDGGHSWTTSRNCSKDVYPNYSDSSSFAGSKVVSCADGTLRLYYTRNEFGSLVYTLSRDYGVTWEGFYYCPEFTCAKSDYSVFQDYKNPGTWYLLFVNTVPYIKGSLFPRTHMVLMRSTDGQNWSKLIDLDYVEEVSLPGLTHNVYQFLDPSLFVDDTYFYVTYGHSLRADSTTHNVQRIAYIRIPRASVEQ